MEDLERIERYYSAKSDKLVYVSTLLTRSLKSGQRVPQEEQEIAILARAAERGIDLLRLSDRNRTQDAECARRDLDEALRASRMTLDNGTKIRILRAGILSAQSRLQYNNRCTTF